MADGREWFLVTLEALPDGYPAAVRLRRLLKAALRSFRLRAVKVEPAVDQRGERGGEGAGEQKVERAGERKVERAGEGTGDENDHDHVGE
jgi:hypothetical protein